MQSPPRSARSHQLRATVLAERAAAQALDTAQRGGSTLAVAGVVAANQVTAATLAQTAVSQMLAEQAVDAAAEALLNTLAFTTSADVFEAMISAVQERRDTRFATADTAVPRTQDQFDAEFKRLVESLVQDAARAAESVATAVREDVAHIRLLSPPSCSRCVVLAGRIYRYSDGFLRHPNCDCIMVPTTEAGFDLVADPAELAKAGLVTGLSKSDLRAISDGADFGQVVNIRRREAGLQRPGAAIRRAGRLTPEGIYDIARTRDEAVELLASSGYIL